MYILVYLVLFASVLTMQQVSNKNAAQSLLYKASSSQNVNLEPIKRKARLGFFFTIEWVLDDVQQKLRKQFAFESDQNVGVH